MSNQKNLTKLYAKDNNGRLRIWMIFSEGRTVYIKHGVEGGSLKDDNFIVDFGFQNRSVDEQIILRINSRLNKKIDEGYTKSREDAINNIRTNALGYKRTAKAATYPNRKRFIPWNQTYIQKKYDGNHMNIININGKKTGYTTGGKLIKNVEEIIDGIQVPMGRILEGELYHHGTPLETIQEWIGTKSSNTDRLTYIFYDIDLENCYSERLKILKSIVHNERSMLAPTDLIFGEIDLKPLMSQSLKDGYEGLILRLINFPHEPGKRSSGVIKVKQNHFKEFNVDDEFLILDIISSADGWAILICETDKGNIFRVSAPGTVAQKTKAYEEKEKYIGLHVRVDFVYYTKKSKVPFQPVATQYREKHLE